MALGGIAVLKLAANEFYVQLKQGQLSPSCYWLHGDELLLVQEAASEVQAQLREQNRVDEHQVFYADLPGFNWQDFLLSAGNGTLFATRRSLELRLIEQKPTVQILGYIQQFLYQNQDDILIISSQKLDARLQKHKHFLALNKTCVEVAFWPLQGRNLQQWLSQRARQHKLTLTPAALDCLRIQTEGNLLAAAQELEKLALFYAGQQIDETVVYDHVTQDARFQIFQLMDDALAGQHEGVVRGLIGLQSQGESAVLVLWGMLRDIRLLLKVKAGASEAELRRENVWPRRLRLLQQAARRLSTQTLESLILECQHAELAIKGVDSGCAWQRLMDIACVLMGLRRQ